MLPFRARAVVLRASQWSVLRASRELPRSIHILLLGTFVNRAGAFVLPFLALYVSVRLGLGPRIGSLALAAYGIGSLVGSLVGGQLADRYGRRTVMVASLVGSALCLLALSRAQAVAGVLAASFGLSLISDMYRPAGQAFIADVVPAAQRVHAFALNYIAINLGFAFAPFVGGILAERSFALLFYVDAFTSAFFGLLIAFTLPESLAPPTESQRVAPRESLLRAWGRIFRHRVFMLFCLALFLVSLCFAQALATLPISMNELGIGEKTYGRIMAVNGVMIVLLQLPITAFVLRMSRSTALCMSAVLVGTGFGLNSVAGTWVGLVGTVAVWTCGEMMQAPMLGPVVADLAPAPMRARYMAFSGVAVSLAVAVGSMLGGHFFASYGQALFWPGAAMTAFVGGSIFLALGKRLAPGS